MECPNCLLEIELHLNSYTGQIVKEDVGDLGVCFSCGQSMIFDGQNMLAITPSNREVLPLMVRLQLHWQWQKWNLNHSIRGN